MGIGCLHGLRVRVDPFDAGTRFHYFPQENRLLAWSGLSRAMITHRSACEPEDGAAGSPGAAPSGRIGRPATTRGAGARRRKPATERVAGHVTAAAERCRPEAVGALGALRQRPPTDPPSRCLHRAPPWDGRASDDPVRLLRHARRTAAGLANGRRRVRPRRRSRRDSLTAPPHNGSQGRLERSGSGARPRPAPGSLRLPARP